MVKEIYNEDCEVTLQRLQDNSIDVVLTSPPYNINSDTFDNDSNVYDEFIDNMTKEEYIAWILRLFTAFDRVLKPNGVVIWNAGYGNNVGANGAGVLWEYIAEIIHNTPFTVADKIIWKKNSAIPINTTNKLTRICEDIFIFSRKSEIRSFHINKKHLYKSKHGNNISAIIHNFIAAPNNDESCPLNKATYSSTLCEKLLSIYAPINEDTVVYDPFMGTGTTAVACTSLGIGYVGSELSSEQCKWAENRLKGVKGTVAIAKNVLF